MPQALNIGVDYHTFWELNPRRLKSFVIAYEQKAKRDAEIERKQMNIEAWLIGVYVQKAISSAFTKDVKFPTKPLAITEEDKEQDNMAQIKAKLEAFAINHNRKFEK